MRGACLGLYTTHLIRGWYLLWLASLNLPLISVRGKFKGITIETTGYSIQPVWKDT